MSAVTSPAGAPPRHAIKDTLNGRTALVTGAGSGIGKATAKTLAYAGARVAVLGRTAKELKATADEIASHGGAVLPLLADVGNPEEMEKAFALLKEKWKTLDIVVANAGINGIRAPIEKIKVKEWDEVLGINLRGTFLTLKLAAPLLKKKGGAAVVISSVNGNRLFSSAGSTPYSCSKAAQVALVKLLTLEFGPHKVRINAICPGSIHTKIDDSTYARDKEEVEIPSEFPKGSIPLNAGKPGGPGEVAELAWFLVSPYSTHITGTEVYIDGGQSLVEG
ncbi:MAG TPA: SDR family NAD(P)-dependent oxidoreductase [Candidatus Methylacidiphilales bacterium]